MTHWLPIESAPRQSDEWRDIPAPAMPNGAYDLVRNEQGVWVRCYKQPQFRSPGERLR